MTTDETFMVEFARWRRTQEDQLRTLGMKRAWQERGEGNVDSLTPLTLDLYIPPDTKDIRQAKLRLRLRAFRSYGTGAASGGGWAGTGASGGGATPTSEGWNRLVRQVLDGAFHTTYTKAMKLSAWAKQQGIDYKTAYRWFRAGILPVPSRQLPTGTILVDVAATNELGRTVLYARVSSSDQKSDLDRQLARLVQFASENRLSVVGAVAEIGSGLNGKRPKLLKVLADRSAEVVLVEHRDRLARFGAEYIEAALQASGRRIMVVNQTEMLDDLVQDMIDVLTSFCARLYGRRAAKNRAKRALEAAAQ